MRAANVWRPQNSESTALFAKFAYCNIAATMARLFSLSTTKSGCQARVQIDILNMKTLEFTKESLQLTRSAWMEAAEANDIPSVDFEAHLDWAEKRIDYSNANGDSFAYGIFSSEGSPAAAIIDIVYRRMTGADVGWLKMLTIMFSPELAPKENEDPNDRAQKLLEIYGEAIKGTISLTGQHKARVVKLYSRSDSQYSLLLALNERLNANGTSKFSSKIQGRWLVLNAN